MTRKDDRLGQDSLGHVLIAFCVYASIVILLCHAALWCVL